MVLDFIVFHFRIETGRISPLFLIVMDITICSVFTMYFMCFRDWGWLYFLTISYCIGYYSVLCIHNVFYVFSGLGLVVFPHYFLLHWILQYALYSRCILCVFRTEAGRISLLVLMVLGILALDIVYIAVVISYCVQCSLLVFYIRGLQEKVKEKIIDLPQAVKVGK